MNLTTLLNQLNEIENVIAVETAGHKIHVINALADFSISLNPSEIASTDFVIGPVGQRVLRLRMSSGGIIVTPDDYVFNVEQDEFIQVDDAPPMCSITEMINGLERYVQNPIQSDNMDNCVGLYYIHYYIVKSAMKKGFKVDVFMDQLRAIDEEFCLNVCDLDNDSSSS